MAKFEGVALHFPRMRGSQAYLALGVAFGILALCSVMSLFNGLAGKREEWGKLISIPVAARDLGPGEILDESTLVWAEFPEKCLPRGVITDPRQVQGRRLIGELGQGEPLFFSQLDSSTKSVNTSSLPRDMCAFPLSSQSVSLPVREVWPGQRLDIIAVGEADASLLLEDVEVIALSLPIGERENGPDAYEGHIFLKLTEEEACLLAKALKRGQVEAVISGEASF